MKDEYGKKKYLKRIFIFTDGNVKASKNKIKSLVKAMDENDVRINLICIGFNKKIDLEEGEILEEDTDNKTQKAFVECIDSLDEESNGRLQIISATQASNIQNDFRKKRINPSVKYRGALKITPNLSLDINVFVKTAETKIPSLKKFSKVSDYNGDIKMNKIKNEKIYYIHDDPEQIPVSDDRIIKAFYYGKSLVPVTPEEELLFKCCEEKDFRAIGFTNADNIPRNYFIGGTDVVFPNPSDTSQVKAFYTIVEGMISLNKVLLARIVTRAKSEPKLVVLHPHIGEHGPLLYMNQLPTSEDIRDYQFESFQECTPQQEEVMSGFIDELDMDANEDEEKEFKPSNMFNPILQYFYDCLESRALNTLEGIENSELPQMNDKIRKMINPTKDKLNDSKYAGIMKEVFNIRKSKSIYYF